MIHERVLRDILARVQNLEFRVTNLELLETQHTLLHDLVLREDSPTLEFQETDQTLPSGRWRIRLDGDLLRFERSTSGAGNFSTLDSKMVLGATGLFINETSNSNMTIGLTINQGANDNEILALKSSDVAHGMTSLTETDTFLHVRKQSSGLGGAFVRSFKESSGGNAPHSALLLYGVLGEPVSTTKSTSGYGIVRIGGAIKSGTSWGEVNANGNIISFEQYDQVKAILDAEGDLHLDSTLTQNAWDNHDDLVLLHGLRASLVPELQERFGHFIEEARPILEATGVITYNDDGHHFIAMKKLSMLLCDALRQLGERYRKLEKRIAQYERVLLELGADPQMLMEGIQDAG